jgi:hypothetical protein
MATYFSINNGNITDLNVFGLSLTSAEVTNNTRGIDVTTRPLYAPFAISNGDPITAVAVNLSAYNVVSSDNLILNLKTYGNPRFFYDSSSYNLPVNTSTGATVQIAQNTFSPYHPSGWSGYFNGSNHLSTSSFNLGNSPFTIEGWFWPISSIAPSTALWGQSNGIGATPKITLYINSLSALILDCGSVPAIGLSAADAITQIAPNTWNHISVMRVSQNLNDTFIFLNGNQIARGTLAGTLTGVTTANRFNIGTTGQAEAANKFAGYISNFRAASGIYVPDANYLLSPISATPDTIFLTLQKNRIYDTTSNRLFTQTGTIPVDDRSPFISEPYNSAIHGGSGLFNGSSDFLTVPTTTALNLSSRDFTIESWVNTTHTTEYVIFGSSNFAGNIAAYNLLLNPGSTPTLRFYCKYGPTGAGTLNQSVSLPYSINDAGWHHVAVTREGANLRFYLNGSQVGTTTTTLGTSAILANPFNTFNVGALQDNNTNNFKGYMHGLRVISNSALYSGTTYTPPTGILTSDSNTALLLNHNNLFALKNNITATYPISSLVNYNDNNNINTSHSLAWQTFKLPQPLATIRGEYVSLIASSTNDTNLSLISNSAACIDLTNNFPSISASSISFSPDSPPIQESSFWFFSSSLSSNISFPSSSLFDFSNGTYTIEFWMKPASFPVVGNVCRLLSFGTNNSTSSLGLKLLADGTLGISRSVAGALGINTPPVSALPLNQWTHVAVSVDNSFGKIFLNGTLAVSGIITSPAAGNIGLTVGYDPALPTGVSARYDGYISNLHVNNSESLYDKSFPTPTTAPTPTTGTSLLLKSSANFNRGIITNTNTLSSNLTVNSGALVLSDDSPYGAGVDKSIVFDGTTFLTTSDVGAKTFDKDFTVELWIKPTNSTATEECIIDARTAGGAAPLILSISRATNTNRISLFLGTWTDSTISTIVYGNWNHIAVVRRGTGTGNLVVYTNGVPAITATNTSSFSFMGIVSIAKYQDSPTGLRFKGNVANINIVNGVALYASSFNSASLQPSANTLNTVFLLKGSYFNSLYPTLMPYTYNPVGDVHIVGAVKETDKETSTVYVDNYCADSNLYIHNNGIFRVNADNKTLTINGVSGMQITPNGQFILDAESSLPSDRFTFNLLVNTTIDVHDGGVLTVKGPQKLPYTYLGTNSVSASNAFTTTDTISTQWLTGDYISIIPNTSSKVSFDYLILSGIDSLNTFKTTTTALNNHLAISAVNYIPSVVNLNRNVKIRGYNPASSTFSIRADKSATVLIKNAEFINVGKSTYGYHGIIFGTNLSGSLHLANNVFSCANIANIASINTINTRLTASNLTLDRNVFFNTNETPISLSGISANNVTITNNYILSANNIGLYWRNISGNNIIMNNNYIPAAKTHGCVVSSCSATNSIIGGTVNYNNTLVGLVVTGNNVGTIGNVIASHSPAEGVRIDGNSATLSSTYFYNITAINNSGFGIDIINNTTNLLSSIVFNLENSLLQNNLSGGFEGYSITGNIKNVNIINNPNFGMRTSFGNGPLTILNLSSINQSVIDLPVTKVSAMSSFAGPFDPLINDSIYFNGSTDNIAVNDTTNILSNIGSSDWTIESWVYLSRMPTTNNTWPGVMSIVSTNSNFACAIGSTNFIVAYNDAFISNTVPHNLTTSKWYHLVYSRKGSILYFYVDGILKGVTTVSSTANASTIVHIGSKTNTDSRFAGYISNLRITTNASIYQKSFSVPTGALSATPNTLFLINPSSTKLDLNKKIIDSSKYNHQVFPVINGLYGSVAQGTFSPFATGGSIHVSDRNYTLTTLSTGLSSNDFTIEAWIYPRSLPQYSTLFQLGGSGSFSSRSNGIFLRMQENNNNRITLVVPSGDVNTANGVLYTGISGVTLNKWSHLALVKQVSSYNIYLDGTRVLSATGLNIPSFNPYQEVLVGGDNYAQNINNSLTHFNGYVSNFRIESLSAVYTSNFTPPAVPLSATDNTLLLLKGENADYPNPISATNIGFAGTTITIDPSVPSNTDASLSLSNYEGGVSNGDHLQVIPTSAFALSSRDFTIEAYFNVREFNSVVSYLFDTRNVNASTTAPVITIGSDRILTYNTSGLNLVSRTVFIANKWYHLAIVRRNNTVYMYVDGTLESTGIDTTVISTTDLYIGAANYAVPVNHPWFSRFNAKMHFGSIRITDNAVYNIDFTPITSPLTVQSNNTKLLYNLPYGNTLKASVSTINIAVLSGYNYHPIYIKDSYIGSDNPIYFGTPILLDGTKFNEFYVENSTLSSSVGDISINNRLNGSYLFNNCKFGPILPTITRTNYQPDTIRSSGFAYTSYQQVTGYHLTLLPNGQRLADKTTVSSPAGDVPSERLTPNSNILIRSGSKFLAINTGNAARVTVDVRKSSTSYTAPDSTTYNGINPRLILKANSAVGVDRDIVLAEAVGFNENYITLTGDTPYVTEDGVLEFYVECNGTQGFINIDNWTINAI